MSGTTTKARDPMLGQTLGDEFVVKSQLGEGGMGAVYLATQRLTEREVAVKVLHKQLFEDTLLLRFRQEAQIVSKLSHPNIITIYKFGESSDGTLFIAMEYVQGSPLGAIMDETREFDVERALPLMIQMVEALAYAHEQKIVHRDIKPDNMIITRTGRNESVKLLDFGIAKMMDGNAALTRTGTMCGSPIFMSPEQWKQVRDLDGRTDLYSLGCVWYAMMTGRNPHHADTVVGYMMAHTSEKPKHALEVSNTLSQLPALADIIMRCMEIDREDRYADAYALLDALKEAELEYRAKRRAPASVPPKAKPSIPPADLLGPGSHVSSANLMETAAGRPSLVARPSETEALLVDPVTEPEASARPFSIVPPEPSELKTVPSNRTGQYQAIMPAVEKGGDKVHLLLSAVGVVMLALLSVAVFMVR